MKLSKLIAIQAEQIRFNKKLEEAIVRAKANDTDGHNKPIAEKDRDCLGTKEGAAFKRACMDFKSELTHLNQ